MRIFNFLIISIFFTIFIIGGTYLGKVTAHTQTWCPSVCNESTGKCIGDENYLDPCLITGGLSSCGPNAITTCPTCSPSTCLTNVMCHACNTTTHTCTSLNCFPNNIANTFPYNTLATACIGDGTPAGEYCPYTSQAACEASCSVALC